MLVRKLLKFHGLLVVSIGLSGCPFGGSGPSKPKLNTDEQKVSYIIGYQIGSNLRQDGFSIDQNDFLAGMEQGMEGGESLIAQEDAMRIMSELQTKLQEDAESKQMAQAVENKQEGQKFLEENAKRDEVVVLPSGLQYEVIEEGQGESPSESDVVITNYRGTLLDGTQFDSSYQRGEPATFTVNRVIAGWTEALQLMKPGAKWKLYVPSDLAYGESGAGGMIGPNATLVFEVELIGIKESVN